MEILKNDVENEDDRLRERISNMSLTDPQYWKAQKKLGRPRKIPSPEILWEACCDYFAWAVSNPMVKREALKGGDRAGEIIEINIDRAFTWQDLENHLRTLGLAAKLDDYRANKNNNYAEYSDILTHVETIIVGQKFQGAVVGTYNPNIIARDLGLSDKTEQTVKVEQPLF